MGYDPCYSIVDCRDLVEKFVFCVIGKMSFFSVRSELRPRIKYQRATPNLLSSILVFNHMNALGTRYMMMAALQRYFDF